MDLDDGFVAAKAIANPPPQIGQSVLELAKDNELASVAVLVGHERVVKDRVELVPLGVLARADDIASELGLENYRVLFSIAEYKKTSMRYFLEDRPCEASRDSGAGTR